MRWLVALGLAGLAVATASAVEAAPRAPSPRVEQCTTCHRGDGTASAKVQAHAGMFANPSDLRVALGLGLFTSREHPKLVEFGQAPDFRWDRIVDEEGRPPGNGHEAARARP